MSGENEGGGPSLLVGTLKVAAVFGIGAYGLATWLSHGGLEQTRLDRFAAAFRQVEDPVTTGSIAAAGRAVVLDPCTILRR